MQWTIPMELEAMRVFADLDAVMGHMVKHGYPRFRIQSIIDHFPVDHTELRKMITEDGNPVASYLESLNMLKKLKLDMILPRHRPDKAPR